jgi:hypothetical protein
MARKTTRSTISNGKKKSKGGLKNPGSSGKYDELGKRIRLRRVEIDISQSGLAGVLNEPSKRYRDPQADGYEPE